MSKLRGDDDLLSLMDEMSSYQGYDKPAASEIIKKEASRVRLTDEISGYPSTKKLVGTAMIWNPYIQASGSGIPKHVMVAPTNPQVEVFRRRAYERFKTEFRERFEHMAMNATAKSGPSNLWKELSVPSMMERWHFDVKLEEFLMLRDEHAGVPWQTIFSSSSCFTTSQIKFAIAQNDSAIMDPILISTDKTRRNRRQEKRDEPTPKFRSASSLFTDELRFEWTRTWKRKAGDKFQESALKPIFESSRFQKKVSRISRSVLDSAAEVEASFFAEVNKRAALESTTNVSRRSKKSQPKIVMEDEDVHVKFSGLSFKVHLEHYQKLQIMFDRMHPSSFDLVAHEAAFCSALFCLLARYDMLQGAGLQSSMHGSVFDVLLQHFDCRLECFASPLNSRYERFCSAFADTDAPFGSVGSFFDYEFSVGGCYQANPPFVANFIRSMHETMVRALHVCVQPLMFVVFVPTWKETSEWNLLMNSLYLRKHVMISQASHFYCEGTQHRRKDRYRVASFDTSVFFLQNDAACRKWPITDVHIADLKAAFQIDPEQVAIELPTPADKSSPPPRSAPHGTLPPKNEKPHCVRTTFFPQKKAKEKRKFLSEEGTQQLDILNSLGMSDHKREEKTSSFKKSRKKKRK